MLSSLTHSNAASAAFNPANPRFAVDPGFAVERGDHDALDPPQNPESPQWRGACDLWNYSDGGCVLDAGPGDDGDRKVGPLPARATAGGIAVTGA